MAERNYGHLLAAAFGKGKKAKTAGAEDTTDDQEGKPHTPPANDQSDGKKGKGAKKSGKKAGEGTEDEDEEEEDSEEGEGEESRETSQEEEEDAEDAGEDKKRGKKGKKASATAASIIAAERIRIKRILSSDAAAASPKAAKAAMVLALETSMPAGEAVAFLSLHSGDDSGATAGLRIDKRMSTQRSPDVGVETPTDGAAFSGPLTVTSMEKMTPAQKGKLITAAGMIRRGEASDVQDALKKLA